MDNATTNTLIIAFGMLFVVLNALALGMSAHIGDVLAHFARNWKSAVLILVVNFVIIPGLVVGLTALLDIPSDLKIGFCIVALVAGAPFAPLLTRLARGDVATSTTMFIALTVGTILLAPLFLPLAVTALVPSVGLQSYWDVAWPLLAFLAAPIALGCIARLRYPRFAQAVQKPFRIVYIVCLLLYVNVFIVGYWSLFTQAWGSGAYLAAFGVPILGILFGSLLGARTRGIRHARVITTAERSISGAIIVTVFSYTQPLANVAVTIINTIAIVILLVLSLEWGRAAARRTQAAAPAASAAATPR